jgi:uncharacterized phage protein (TIGR02218 family)
MTVYDDYDRSVDGAKPAELFQFSGGIQAYYTTRQRPILYMGATYEPDYIVHGEIEQSEELSKQELEITLKSSASVARLYIADVPPNGVNVRVFRFIEGISEFRLVWAGRVVKADFDSENDECRLACEPIFTMLKRPGLRRNYQLLCPYALYDNNCGKDIAPYTSHAIVAAVAGGRVTMSGINVTSGYYIGGIFRFGSYLKLIINHVGNTLTLASAVPGLTINTYADVSAGCDKTLSTCANRFGNTLNFGGFPYIPTRNIFTGDSMTT